MYRASKYNLFSTPCSFPYANKCILTSKTNNLLSGKHWFTIGVLPESGRIWSTCNQVLGLCLPIRQVMRPKPKTQTLLIRLGIEPGLPATLNRWPFVFLRQTGSEVFAKIRRFLKIRGLVIDLLQNTRLSAVLYQAWYFIFSFKFRFM